jgi:hypothetical protein
MLITMTKVSQLAAASEDPGRTDTLRIIYVAIGLKQVSVIKPSVDSIC